MPSATGPAGKRASGVGPQDPPRDVACGSTGSPPRNVGTPAANAIESSTFCIPQAPTQRWLLLGTPPGHGFQNPGEVDRSELVLYLRISASASCFQHEAPSTNPPPPARKHEPEHHDHPRVEGTHRSGQVVDTTQAAAPGQVGT